MIIRLPRDEAVSMLQKENRNLERRVKALETRLRRITKEYEQTKEQREKVKAAYQMAVSFTEELKGMFRLWGEEP